MINQSNNEVLSLYESRLEKYGNSFKTVGWGSKEDQFLRFDMLFREININNKSILDLGCGLGDMVEYLHSKKSDNFFYTGVDLSEKLIKQAKINFPHKNVKFLVNDVLKDKLPRADIVVASGTLTYNISENKENIQNILERFFLISNDIVSVNFMSSYVDFELEKNLHFSPEKIFSSAKNITNWVTIFHDYPLFEFTVHLKKQETL
jgi:SAM-dependent methyltransferase